jgi:signal transduction histidine kinase
VSFSITLFHDNLPEIEDELAKVHIFRVLQEALNNASKYSECKQVSIQLIGEEENLIFSVEDDGKGFDIDAVAENESNGMKNMQYRAELLGTDLEIESQEGKGTFISLKIPLFKLSYADSTN